MKEIEIQTTHFYIQSLLDEIKIHKFNKDSVPILVNVSTLTYGYIYPSVQLTSKTFKRYGLKVQIHKYVKDNKSQKFNYTWKISKL